MGLRSDATALLLQWTARWFAKHGDELDLPDDGVEDAETWKVPTRHGTVRCTLHRPTAARHRADGDHPAVLVHLHGGAFVMRYPEMDHFFTRFVASRTGLAVVSVDYGVAPRHRYPVAHEQVLDVVEWFRSHAADGGLDGSRVALSGFSAGGNLAAAATLLARAEGRRLPSALVLGVPALDIATTTKRTANPRPMIDGNLVRLVRATYFRDESRRAEPYASPLRADDLHGMPPTLVLTAELDSLRAEGDAFAERLEEAGNTVEHIVVPGKDHYFTEGGGPQAERLLGRLADFAADHVRG